MLIDWFTIIAQVFNFLILVWLMKRFLYKPILNAIQERENRIATELATADSKKEEAQKEIIEFKQKNKDFEEQRTNLFNKIKEEGQTERQRLLAEAQQTASSFSLKQQENLQKEEEKLHQTISQRTQQEVFAITKKILKDLADSSVEERMLNVFIRRLRELSDENKKLLTSPLQKSDSMPIIRTAFNLTEAQHSITENAITEILGTKEAPRFETSAELISGIELSMNGQKLSWNIADYLTMLEKDVSELLQAKDKQT